MIFFYGLTLLLPVLLLFHLVLSLVIIFIVIKFSLCDICWHANCFGALIMWLAARGIIERKRDEFPFLTINFFLLRGWDPIIVFVRLLLFIMESPRKWILGSPRIQYPVIMVHLSGSVKWIMRSRSPLNCQAP